MKKYNRSTGNYKIDVFVNGVYLHSTDWQKTCKAAIARAIELYPALKSDKVTANFARI